MAIKSQAQIQAESNSTYVDNSVGSITPNSVRSLNTNWIDSIIFAEATASLTVFGATSASFAVTASNALTASFLLGSVASSSFSQFAVSSSQATSASFASTASFISGTIASASFATSASRAISAATATSASFASTTTSASFATSASRAISSLSASYAFTASSATNSANAISASFATSASIAISSATATSSSFANTSTSASFATTASFALNVPATASFAISSSFAQSASLATRNILTASAAANILTFTKGDGTTFNVSIAQSGSVVSASYADTANFANSASYAYTASSAISAYTASSAVSASQSISASYAYTASSAINASASLTAISSSYALSASFSQNAATASVLLGSVVSSSYALTASGVQGINASIVNSTYYLGFVPNAEVNAISIDTDLNYNPSSGTLSINTINGALNGNASTATSAATATSASFATNAATASVLLGSVVSSSYATTASSAEKSFEAVSSSYAFTASSAISSSFASVAATVLGTISSASFAISASRAISAESATSASYALSASFASTAGTVTGTVTSASYALSASFAEKSVNTIVVTNNGSGYYLLDGVVKPVVTFVPGETYKFDTSGVVGSHPFRFSLTANGPTTYDVGVTVGTNYTEIEVDYATSSSLFYYCTNHSGMGNEANTLRSEDLIKASQTSSMSVLSASFATTASFALNGGGGAAFPFSGSAVITGSLVVTGSSLFLGPISGSNLTLTNSGSILLFSTTAANNRGIENMLISDSGSRNNIIGIAQTDAAATGSFVVSGSGNLINITGILNSSVNSGAVFGFTGDRAIITVIPTLTGSNATKTFPTITTATVNSTMLILDNRVSETNRAINISNSNVNSTMTAHIASGSIGILNSGINGTTLTLINSGSGTSAGNAFMQNSTICATATNIVYAPTGSGQSQLATSLIVGATNRLLMTGSSAGGGTAVANPCILDSMILGKNLIVTGSSASSAIVPIALVGSFNLANGLLNDGKFTRFAVGTGAAEATRRTSFHVSASGMVTCFDGLTVTGSLNASDITGSLFGTASFASFAATASFFAGSVASASFAETSVTASFATNFVNSGSYVITGSHRGNVVSQSIASSTASFDFSTGNFFTLNLTGSALTHISASNIQAGQTVNVRITQGATTGSLSFSPAFDQVSGSEYVPTQVANAVDILTFITFDNSLIYVSNIKNLV